jgi:Domain of unknown function (DUF4170)
MDPLVGNVPDNLWHLANTGLMRQILRQNPRSLGDPTMPTTPTSNPTPGKEPKQLLHLVFGGELKTLDGLDFRSLKDLDIVGMYPNYAEAHKAWKAKAQGSVDNAHMRYFIVHMHKLLDPDAT